jgi:hypothetical protein
MSTQLPTAVPAGLWLEERGAEYVVHDHAHHHEAHELVLRSQTLPELKRTPRDQPARRRAYPSRSSPAGAQRGPGRARRGRASARAALSLGPDLDICARPTGQQLVGSDSRIRTDRGRGAGAKPGGRGGRRAHLWRRGAGKRPTCGRRAARPAAALGRAGNPRSRVPFAPRGLHTSNTEPLKIDHGCPSLVTRDIHARRAAVIVFAGSSNGRG